MIRLLRWVRRNADLVVELAAYVMWLLLDMVVAANSGTFVPVLAGIVVPGIVLLRRRPGTDLVTISAFAVGTSLSISVLTATPVVALLGAGPRPSFFLSFTELLALAVIVVAVLRRCELRPALVLTVAAAVAIVGSPVIRFVNIDARGLALPC